MVFEIARFLMPRPIEEKGDSRSILSDDYGYFRKEGKTKQLVFAEMSSPSLESQETILSRFANTFNKRFRV